MSETLVVDSCAAHSGAACVIENTRPPIVTVAVLGPFVVLAAAE